LNHILPPSPGLNPEDEAIPSSETLAITYKTTRRHNPEDNNTHLHLGENLKPQARVKIRHKVNDLTNYSKISRV
jgi:hypothetical protein